MELLSMESWWGAMGNAEKIYWLIAVPSTVLFLVQLILTFVVGDVDHIADASDHDVSFDHDQGIGFQFISIKNLVGFFAIFGWTGIAMLHGGKTIGATVFISAIAGILMMVIMASLMYYLGKLTEDSTLNLSNAIGKIGTVYLRIPSKRSGMGKVQLNVQGFQTLDAITDDLEDIKTGAVIEVINTVNNEVLLVKKQ
ncbi:MAG: hypothetical protein R6W78_10490 [Bacteroidales bacterium]